MESCIAEWVTPLLGHAEVPDVAQAAHYRRLFEVYRTTRQQLSPVWEGLADLRAGVQK
jgi:erythritol kinase